MCIRNNIDTVLEQLEFCENYEQMRHLLDEATPCKMCSKELRNAEGAEHSCRCLEHSRSKIQNQLASLIMKTG